MPYIMEKLLNHAHFKLNEDKNSGESEIYIDGKIGFLHALVDNPKAEFDIVLEDVMGNEQFRREKCSNPTGRWGERIDLELPDNVYKVRVEHVKNAKTIDLFAD